MFWVYILQCADGSYYTGHTDNLDKRMGQHHAGECDGYVAAHRPVKLIWSQECASRQEALSAEQQIKGWGRKKKEAMMRGDWGEVSRLTQSKPPVRPEFVEGQNTKAVRGELVEPHVSIDKSAHPSTSPARSTPVGTPPLRGDPSAGSGRTDLSLPDVSVGL